MAATTLDGNRNPLLGAPVYTADGRRLGSVVDGNAEHLHVSGGFLFKRHYIVRLSDVDHYEDGEVILKLALDQVHEVGKH